MGRGWGAMCPKTFIKAQLITLLFLLAMLTAMIAVTIEAAVSIARLREEGTLMKVGRHLARCTGSTN
jgi:hypothetical protein